MITFNALRLHKIPKYVFNESFNLEIQMQWQRYFDAPAGDDPVALDMKSMNKGMVWINGRSIGRYWVSYLSPLGRPTQSE